MSLRRVVRAVRLVVFVTALFGLLLKSQVDAQLVQDAPGCPGSGDLPSQKRTEEAKATMLCLMNAERARHGLAPLVRDVSLDRASQLHSEDMAARNFFAHDTPDGIDPGARIGAAGYPTDRASTAENLYWGTHTASTPVRAVQGLMESPGHRANILHPEMRAVGVGIAYGSPRPGDGDGDDGGALYTTDFGGMARTLP